MIRYFFTVAISFLAALWVTDLLVVNVEERVFNDQIWPAMRHATEGTANLVSVRIEGLKGPELSREIAVIEGELGYPIRLIFASDTEQLDRKMLVPVATSEPHLVAILDPTVTVTDELETGMSLILPGVLLILLLVGLVLVFPLACRIRKHERAIEKITSGDFSVRVPEGSGGLLGQLESRINSMVDRIEELVNAQRHLMQAVAHEMRTPAARMRFGFEMLTESQTEAERVRLLASIDQDMTEVDTLLQELLEFMRLENQTPMTTEPVDIFLFLEQLAQQNLAKDVSITIDAAIQSTAGRAKFIETDRATLHRAVQNLVRNAVRHADNMVELTFCKKADDYLVQVHDDGPGVPAAQRLQIFEPFTRLDESRSRYSGGCGLGLAIAQRATRQIGGTITVEDSHLGGACFSIHLQLERIDH